MVPMLWCNSHTPPADLSLDMLFRMTPDRVSMGFGGDDVGCAWMMITRRAGRMLARSIAPWVIGALRCGVLKSTGSADLSSSMSVDPPSLCRGAACALVSVLRWY